MNFHSSIFKWITIFLGDREKMGGRRVWELKRGVRMVSRGGIEVFGMQPWEV